MMKAFHASIGGDAQDGDPHDGDVQDGDGGDGDLEGQAAIVSKNSRRRRQKASWAAFLQNIYNDDEGDDLIQMAVKRDLAKREGFCYCSLQICGNHHHHQ